MMTSRPSKKRRARTTFVVDVRIPRHSSALSKLNHPSTIGIDCAQALVMVCHQPGTLWRAVGPMLALDDSPPPGNNLPLMSNQISNRMFCVLFQNSLQSTTSAAAIKKAIIGESDVLSTTKDGPGDDDTNEQEDTLATEFHHRQVNVSLDCLVALLEAQNPAPVPIKIQLYILPSCITLIDMTFIRLVLQHERTLLKKQSLSAWMATLGGGFFFIRRLSYSLLLARQQRVLALQIGNRSMARTCLLNEAYNLIYAGKFRNAKVTLKLLEDEVSDGKSIEDLDDDEAIVTLRQCGAARLLLRRLKKMSKSLQKYHTRNVCENHTRDDFQRLRIVAQEL